MNVVFVTGNEDLDKNLQRKQRQLLYNLGGHRSIGGMRTIFTMRAYGGH